ncbi:MAG: hypothetical protein C5B54_05725 [Acidobacteria bacterium]|nr:MAG: hypothetical protein C5B54_05725 [Acidobacteriota bacterium]
MSTFDAANHYFSGQGVVMIGSRNATTGEPTGLRPVGNVPDMKITVATTVVEHKGSQDGQRATDARLQTEIKVACAMVLENWIAVNLAKALRGDSAPIPSGSATDEALVAYPGLVTGFKYIKVSSVVLKQSTTTLTEFIDGTQPWDYKLNAEAGSIMMNDGVDEDFDHFTPGSPVTDGVDLTVSYDYDDQYLVNSLTQPLKDNWLRFEGLNTVEENAPVIVDVFRFQNDPLRELALLSDTFGQFVIEGSVLKDDSRKTGSKYFHIKKMKE